MTDYGLSTQQLQVINALSSGASVTHAAQQAGLHRNTINNWRRNFLPFQYALADAQYDRALYFREKMEDLAGLAITTLQDLLADPKAPASVRLKAALAILQTATTPPPPKKQIELDFEHVVVHQPAQPATSPTCDEEEISETPEPTPDASPELHNPAQQPRTTGPKIGRNEPCPCGSGAKYKRCCLNKPQAAAA